MNISAIMHPIENMSIYGSSSFSSLIASSQFNLNLSGAM
jgi:hypothetical protein